MATDNVMDFAWAPTSPESAGAAMRELELEGYTRIESADGIYLALRGDPPYADADGWGLTYLFGPKDVRWANTKTQLVEYVKSPTI